MRARTEPAEALLHLLRHAATITLSRIADFGGGRSLGMLSLMVGHQIQITVDGRPVTTLADILPTAGSLRMLMVAKTPAPISVEAGHYFQGTQGTMFWNRLVEYGLLNVPPGYFHDDVLLEHGYGLTDIVKAPRSFGNEPSDGEYRQGIGRIQQLVASFRPRVVLFVYKRVLDTILRLRFARNEKSAYGFNPDYDALFGARMFVFPVPGTPCTRATAQAAMEALAALLAEDHPAGHARTCQ